MEDEFGLEARLYDKTWGKYDYGSDVKFLNALFKEHRCRSIIDVGCGTGNHALRLSRLGYEVVGVDISSTMLKIAKEKEKEAKVRFIQGDMRKLQRIIPENARFDAAICLGQAFSNLITTGIYTHSFVDCTRYSKRMACSFLMQGMRRRSTRNT